MGSRQVEIDFKFRPSEPLPRPDFETATTTTRISKFEPSAARLYFIFRSHFLMPWIRKKIWFLCWKGVWVNGIPPSTPEDQVSASKRWYFQEGLRARDKHLWRKQEQPENEQALTLPKCARRFRHIHVFGRRLRWCIDDCNWRLIAVGEHKMRVQTPLRRACLELQILWRSWNSFHRHRFIANFSRFFPKEGRRERVRPVSLSWL